MGTTLNDTPNANRTHIAFFGKMNSGKSSLINALANQQISIVSKIGGTTTDLVKKPMEIHGIGPCVLIDTAGFDDTSDLGDSRIMLAKQAAAQADLAVLVFSEDTASLTDDNFNLFFQEQQWYDLLQKRNTPVIFVLNKADLLRPSDCLSDKLWKNSIKLRCKSAPSKKRDRQLNECTDCCCN